MQKKFDEPEKGFLAKAIPTTPNKGQMVFVLVHQKTGFLNARLHCTRNTKFLIAQMKGLGNMHSVGTYMLNSVH